MSICNKQTPQRIIKKYYSQHPEAYKILAYHSLAVTKKALKIAKANIRLKPDLKFIKEAGMLHDIGVFLTDAPQIGCYGEKPYLCHGVLGREILEKEGLKKHALVCEKHVGMGITAQEIKKNNLPLPKRDMVPSSCEEEIICLADKFFSKSSKDLSLEEKVEEVKEETKRYGKEKEERLEYLLEKYSLV